MDSEREQIVLIPFMAKGHLRPFLELARRLVARTQFTITILTTPLNAEFLGQQSPSPTIKIVQVPFNPTDHGLPPGIETTDKVPLNLVINLFHSTLSLEPHLRHYLSLLRKPPVCVIFDHFLGWADGVARSVGSVGISFTTAGAYGTAAYASIWENLPHHNFSDDEDFPLPGFPETHRFRRSHIHRFIRFADGSDAWSQFFQTQIRLSKGCYGWLCNSVEEVESLGLDILRNYNKLPVWAIGPLINSSSEKSEDNDEEYLRWLSEQDKDSVLYISYGSQNTISPTQMMELAAGLELSGKRFLWVIRPPFGFDINGEFKPEWLPEGFEERMKEKKQGILVHKWVSQLDILRNESTGGFLTHCGWNSVLESLREGLPMIGWPLAAEQAYNSKMLEEEMGVAVELTRGLEGKLSKEKVKRIVELVMGREEGSRGLEMKKKATEMGKKIKDAVREDKEYKGSSIKALDDFLASVVAAKGKGSA